MSTQTQLIARDALDIHARRLRWGFLHLFLLSAPNKQISCKRINITTLFDCLPIAIAQIFILNTLTLCVEPAEVHSPGT